MERNYEGGHIFQNLEPNLCLYRFVLAFLLFIVDLTFSKILNIYEKSHSRYTNSQLRIQIVQLTCRRSHFWKRPGEFVLKNTEQMTRKKLEITLIYNVKLAKHISKLNHRVYMHGSLVLYFKILDARQFKISPKLLPCTKP